MNRKQIISIAAVVIALCACSVKPIESFTDPQRSADAFFANSIKLAHTRHKLTPMTLNGGMDVYRVRFREQQVEEYGVFEWRMLSENDPRFDTSLAKINEGQDLFIYRLYAPDVIDGKDTLIEDVFIYYSKGVDGKGNCTGISHAYLGRLGTYGSAPAILFYEELKLVHNGSCIYLESVKEPVKEKKQKRRDEREKRKLKNGTVPFSIRYTLDKKPERGDTLLKIDKVIVQHRNKTGGENPVVYDIDPILGDSGLVMMKQPIKP